MSTRNELLSAIKSEKLGVDFLDTLTEEAFQNKGYAKESLKGMWSWVSQFPEVKTLRYTVSPDNLPSIAVINYFGFEYTGQQIDDEDGPENIYEMSTSDFMTKWGQK